MKVKKFALGLIVLFIVVLVTQHGFADIFEKRSFPNPTTSDTFIHAEAATVVDYTSGEVLFSKKRK